MKQEDLQHLCDVKFKCVWNKHTGPIDKVYSTTPVDMQTWRYPLVMDDGDDKFIKKHPAKTDQNTSMLNKQSLLR